jgi:membrane protein involved in colicin uptake
LANLRVKHLSESLREEEGQKKKRRKVVDELRKSGPPETLFMSPSKIQRTRDIASSRELEKQQLQDEKKAGAQARALEKTQKEVEAQRRRDERTAAACARKTAAAQKKAAAQTAREAWRAHKQLESRSRTTNKQ